MAYKKYYNSKIIQNKKYIVLAEVFYQGTSHGFKHGVELITILDDECNSLFKKEFKRPVTCNYLNRTWEEYVYQSVLKKAVRKISKELFDKNIDTEYIIKEVL